MLDKSRHYLEQLLEWSRAEGNPIYIVGGTLRDRALGRDCSDIDMTSTQAIQLADRFASTYDLPRVPLDSTPGREMIRVVLEGELYFDFATLQGKTIEDDLNSRDFTLNAMGLELGDFLKDSTEVIDPQNGMADIRSKIIRQLPGPIFENDPLRLLRAFRFANTLGFQLEPDTLTAIAEHSQAIERIAGERVYYELLLILRTPESHLQPLIDTRLLQTLIPELQNPNLALIHSLEQVLENPESWFPGFGERILQYIQAGRHTALIKIAALLLPLFQENESAPLVELLKRLRFSNSDIHFIDRTLTLHHHLLEDNTIQTGNPDPSVLYRLARLGEEMMVSASLLMQATHSLSDNNNEEVQVSLNQAMDFYYNRYLPAQDHPALFNGTQLEKTFKMRPSPKFKFILDSVEEARVLGHISTTEQAQKMAKDLIDKL